LQYHNGSSCKVHGSPLANKTTTVHGILVYGQEGNQHAALGGVVINEA